MNDDVKAAVARVREWEFYGPDNIDRDILLAHLDGEDARTAAAVAAAREEMLGDVIKSADECLKARRERTEMHRRAQAAEAEAASLRLEVEQLGVSEVELVAQRDSLRQWPCEHSDCDLTFGDVADSPCGDEPSHPDGRLSVWFCGRCWNQTVGGLVAERDALRAQVAEAAERLAECAAANRTWHAQVEAVRALCARFDRCGGLMWPGEVLAAMESATESKR